MKPAVIKRLLTINNREVNVRIEFLFWVGLEEIASSQATTASRLVASIDAARGGTNLSSAIRAFVLAHFRNRMHALDDVEGAPRRAAPRSVRDDEADDDRPHWLN